MARIIRPGRASSASAAVAVCALLAHGAASGSALNPEEIDPTLERDERGMSPFNPVPARTPSGFLYERPYARGTPWRLGEEWKYRFSTELGVLSGSGGAVRNYADYRGGFVLSHLGFAMERNANYLDFTAAAAGRKDQSYRASFGRYGEFRTNLFFDDTPKLFTDQARTVFRGVGSGDLTLAPGLTPGNNTPAQIQAALQSASAFELGFTRTKSGIDVDVTPGDSWRLFARYTQDRKRGTRASGGASSYPGAPVAETIEPLDYKTHELSTGIQWAGDAFQANLGYSGSFFRNGIGALTWDNPLAVGDPAVMKRSRIDLYPDNDFHNLKLDLSASLPMRGQLSGGVSWARSSQDDELVAPTVNSGMLGSLDLSQWNVPGALSQRTAGARIDTRLTHVSGSFSPIGDLSLRAKWRRFEEDNKTRYTAFNPLTGQSGYLGLDGGGFNIVPDNIFRTQVGAVPFSCDKTERGLEADYQLLRRTNVSLGYETEDNDCRHRERQGTAEHRYRLALNNRDLAWATIRLSYEHAKRTGDDYSFDPNSSAYAPSAFLNTPATLAQLRKYDLADREQHIVNARVNFAVAADMDLALSGKYQDNGYGSAYGRLQERIHAFNVEWNWQPRPSLSARAHYGFERVRNAMALINDDPAGYTTGNPDAGGPVYPLANRWEEQSRDDAHLLGLGFSYTFGAATLESGYTYTYSPYRTSYSFASSGALVGGSLAAAGAEQGMPVIKFRQQSFDSSVKYKVDKHTALRLYFRYERARFEDWHYDGLPQLFGTEAVFLGAGPRDYSVSLIGILLQYTSR